MRTLLSLTLLVTLSAPVAARPVEDSNPSRDRDRSDRRARLVEQFDLNGDGSLDRDERAAIRRTRAQQRDGEDRDRRLERHHERHKALLEQFDADGNGELDETERNAMREARRARRLERFDTNGDGVIDEDERAKVRERHRERRERRRGRGPLPQHEPFEPDDTSGVDGPGIFDTV